MAHGVDATMERMQTTTGKAAVDRVRAQTESRQLTAPDHTVLALGQVGDQSVAPVSPHLTAHTAVKCGLGGSSPP